jgi:hypothetical protein
MAETARLVCSSTGAVPPESGPEGNFLEILPAAGQAAHVIVLQYIMEIYGPGFGRFVPGVGLRREAATSILMDGDGHFRVGFRKDCLSGILLENLRRERLRLPVFAPRGVRYAARRSTESHREVPPEEAGILSIHSILRPKRTAI